MTAVHRRICGASRSLDMGTVRNSGTHNPTRGLAGARLKQDAFGTLEHMPRSVEPVRRANLPSSIADRLRRQIAAGQLKVGEQLPGHRELASMYSVSVGSV